MKKKRRGKRGEKGELEKKGGSAVRELICVPLLVAGVVARQGSRAGRLPGVRQSGFTRIQN